MSDAHTTMQHRASEPYHTGETKLRVVHVLGDITTEASGLPTAVVPLTSALGQLGHRVELHTLGSQPAREVRHIQVVYHARWQFSGIFGLSLPLLRAVKALAAEADILHSHSLWTMPAMCPAWVGPGGRARIVISPHGTLTTRALARSKWKKRIAWWGGQRLALQHAAAFHATAESELEDIRHLGFRQPVALVPLGIDLPADPGPSGGGKDGRTLLYVGRLHPMKGLDCLIHTWTCVQDLHPGWRLVVAGGDEDAPGYGSELQRLAHRLGARRIDFVGPVYGRAKWELYRKSDLFILPSHSENFGMVVPEALGNGIPVIASKGTPWAGLKREKCGWWVKNDVETLSRLLDNVFRMDSNTLADMGTRGRTWMQRDFTCNATASQITALYVWLNGLGDRPSCVHLG